MIFPLSGRLLRHTISSIGLRHRPKKLINVSPCYWMEPAIFCFPPILSVQRSSFMCIGATELIYRFWIVAFIQL